MGGAGLSWAITGGEGLFAGGRARTTLWGGGGGGGAAEATTGGAAAMAASGARVGGGTSWTASALLGPISEPSRVGGFNRGNNVTSAAK